jgi:hypothetical protein
VVDKYGEDRSDLSCKKLRSPRVYPKHSALTL